MTYYGRILIFCDLGCHEKHHQILVGATATEAAGAAGAVTTSCQSRCVILPK